MPEQIVTKKDDLLTIGRDLIKGWHSRPESASFRVREQNASIVILTFATHVHRTAPIIFELLEQGLVLEATPLIRLAYENALTSLWLKHVPDGVLGFMNEGVRQRRNIASTLRETDIAFQADSAARIEANLPDEKLETSSSGPAGTFKQLCDDLEPGGAQGYVLYRLLTQYSHPTMYLSEVFLTMPDPPGTLPKYDPNAQLSVENVWAHLTCCALVWSGRAIDMADRNHPRRSELRRAARQLGINPDLGMSERARLRMSKR